MGKIEGIKSLGVYILYSCFINNKAFSKFKKSEKILMIEMIWYQLLITE